MSDLARLTELESLFGRRYQALALVALLEEGPMRWSELGRAMDRRADERVDDKYVTRSLQGLQREGCTDCQVTQDEAQLHFLTARGRARAEEIIRIKRHGVVSVSWP